MGLPTHFINLTAAGVSEADAAVAPAVTLAWMNGVAPLLTMACGVAALFAAEPAKRHGHALIACALGWIAVFGVPYIGLQLMLVAAPANLRGHGADSAAVLVGYLGIAGVPRALIVVLGTLIATMAGFWLPRAIVPEPGRAARTAKSARWGGVPAWRRLLAGLLVAGSIFLIGRGSLRILHQPDAAAQQPFLMALIAWSLGLCCLTRWTLPGARIVRDHWIIPAILASAILGVVGAASHSDYSTIALVLLPQLLVAAFAGQARESRQPTLLAPG